MLYFELLRCVCWLAKVVLLVIAVHFRFLASKALHVPCIMQTLSVFHNVSHGLGRKIRYPEMDQKLCAWMVAQRNKRVIMTDNMCLAFARKWDSASDTEIVWAKNAHGVWGLASSSESDSDETGTSGSGSGLSSHASQTATDSDVSSLTSVDSSLPSGVEEDSDSASDTEIV
jgi:hypothetical protein